MPWFPIPDYMLDLDTKEDRDPDAPICGLRDNLCGVTCSLPEHKDNRHVDDSDWGMVFRWTSVPDVSDLVLPGDAEG